MIIDCTERIKKFKETIYSDVDKHNQWKEHIKQSIIGRKWITLDGNDKQIKPEELDFYLASG